MKMAIIPNQKFGNVLKYQPNDDKKISLVHNRMVSFRIFGQLGVKEVKVISRRFTSATHKKNCAI